jgi:lysyl oxidase-like protein 2/3/4
MRDSEGYDLPEEACKQYDCDDQGITLGCADNYIAGLACQWVDITGIDPGTYRIRVQINADQHMEELDYSNNTGFIDIRITSTEVVVLGP